MPSLVVTAGLVLEPWWAYALVCFRCSSALTCPPDVLIRHMSYEFTGTCPAEWWRSLVLDARAGD